MVGIQSGCILDKQGAQLGTLLLFTVAIDCLSQALLNVLRDVVLGSFPPLEESDEVGHSLADDILACQVMALLQYQGQ